MLKDPLFVTPEMEFQARRARMDGDHRFRRTGTFSWADDWRWVTNIAITEYANILNAQDVTAEGQVVVEGLTVAVKVRGSEARPYSRYVVEAAGARGLNESDVLAFAWYHRRERLLYLLGFMTSGRFFDEAHRVDAGGRGRGQHAIRAAVWRVEIKELVTWQEATRTVRQPSLL